MSDKTRVGIIICQRYHTCAGGKCFRALRNREGAFEIYRGKEIDLVGYTTCAGCPGGNVEYAPEEMQKNGAEVVHLATGLVVGTHPIREKYHRVHSALGTWSDPIWTEILKPTLADEKTRLAYN